MSSWAADFDSATNQCIGPAYSAVGSGTGITDLTDKSVDFAASDAPLSYAQTKALPGPAVQMPDAIGPVTVDYNSASLPKGLNLTGAVIAEIFMGNITTWNNSAITSLNPHLTLPNAAIAVVHRSDSSGTSFVFSGFLSQDSSVWAHLWGQNTVWGPQVGVGARGSGGVVGAVGSTSYAIGYAELNYAVFGSGVAIAAVQNPAGNFIYPSVASAELAVGDIASTLPAGNGNWSAVNMLNQPGSGTYPMVTFTYIMVYQDMGNVFGSSVVSKSTAQATVNFIWWIMHDGQGYSSGLYYVPLPSAVVDLNQATLNSMTYQGAAYSMP